VRGPARLPFCSARLRKRASFLSVGENFDAFALPCTHRQLANERQ
jgi:hypothetical protein